MTIEEYAEFVKLGSRFDNKIDDLLADPEKAHAFLRMSYCVGKLNGEAGELVEEVQKSLRDDAGDFTKRRDNMILELGDVLWYVFAIANELGLTAADIMAANKKKLDKRNRKRLAAEEK